MSSDSTDSGSDRADASTRSRSPGKKTVGKAPRKTRKAAREKQKRDQMNDRFSDLGKALDLDHPNNGKASVLRESIRILGELINQVDGLKKENVTLLSESHYVTGERNELLEETSALEAQIKSLQAEIEDGKNNLSSSHISQTQAQQTMEPHITFPFISHLSEPSNNNPVITPPSLCFVPCNNNPPISMPEAEVPCKPQPRYPSSSDSWPYRILNRQSTTVVEDA